MKSKSMILAVFVLVLAGSGCLPASKGVSSSESGQSADVAAKPAVDLGRLAFGLSQSIEFAIDDGTKCVCNLGSSGSLAQGNLSVGACRASGGSLANADCAAFADSYTISNASGSLRVCDGAGACDAY